ncbi:MAG TPA: hypothetical protein VN538_07820 [Clostridia bacterium]|nr:hypothetical protein [Clostridia bacterium]
MENKELLDSIVDYYLTSHDFNGLPLVSLDGYNANDLEDLIREGMVEAVSFDDCLNPYIRRFDFQITVEIQIRNTRQKGVDEVVLFPTKKALSSTVVDPTNPYSSELKRGEAQLKMIFFDPQTIVMYITNPKYINIFYGHRGYLSMREEYYDPEKDKGELVGDYAIAYKYGDKPERAIGVSLRELGNLSSRQQMRWKSFELPEQSNYVVNKRYAREMFNGEWSNEVWIFDALLEDMVTINVLCEAIGIPPMFFKTYSSTDEERPMGYITLLVPTKRYFYEFIVSLEKLLISNLNPETFTASGPHVRPVSLYDSNEKKKGTLVLLSEWMTANTIPKDNVEEFIVDPLREIRKLRQLPAHRLDVDEYNLDYITKQADVIKAAYTAIGVVRLRLSKHPNCREIILPMSKVDLNNIIAY